MERNWTNFECLIAYAYAYVHNTISVHITVYILQYE